MLHTVATKMSSDLRRATAHRFLEGCADGTVTPAQFNTWLAQDAMYVVAFARFLGATLSVSEESHMPILLHGLAAIEKELEWFKAKAIERGLALETTAQLVSDDSSLSVIMIIPPARWSMSAAQSFRSSKQHRSKLIPRVSTLSMSRRGVQVPCRVVVILPCGSSAP